VAQHQEREREAHLKRERREAGRQYGLAMAAWWWQDTGDRLICMVAIATE